MSLISVSLGYLFHFHTSCKNIRCIAFLIRKDAKVKGNWHLEGSFRFRTLFSPHKLDTSVHFLSSLDGPPVVAHYDISDTSSDPEVVNVDNLLAAAVVQEHTNSVGGQDTGATWRTSGLLEELNAEAGWSPPPPSLMM